jgi:hypothetical protein
LECCDIDSFSHQQIHESLLNNFFPFLRLLLLFVCLVYLLVLALNITII